MGQNGNVTSFMDPTIPGSEIGEEVNNGDALGFRADTNSRIILFKAFAGATAGDNVQCAARGVVARHFSKGAHGAIAAHDWRVEMPVPLPDDLVGLQPGDPLYLSNTVPGALQAAAPSTAGELVQVIGYGYWEGSRDTGINPAEDCNAFIVDIQPATVVPA